MLHSGSNALCKQDSFLIIHQMHLMKLVCNCQYFVFFYGVIYQNWVHAEYEFQLFLNFDLRGYGNYWLSNFEAGYHSSCVSRPR